MVVGEREVKSSFIRFVVGRRPVWTLVRILLLLISTLVVTHFVLVPIRVTGRSMEPTYYDGQIAFVNLLAYKRHLPRRGDIIAFRSGPQVIMKRVIGLPGERIAFHTGVVEINGERLEEPYLTSPGSWEWPEELIGEKSYFVDGDNRAISQQFRVEESNILGKVFRLHR